MSKKFFIKYLLNHLILPLPIFFIIYIMSFFLYSSTSSFVLIIAQFFLNIILYCFSTTLFSNFIASFIESKYSEIKFPFASSNTIVVLGGDLRRTCYAASIARSIIKQGRPLKLILTGGDFYYAQDDEVKSMDLLAKFLGIPAESINLASQSLDTLQQAVAVKSLVGTENFFLVTSAIHTPRAMKIFIQHKMRPKAAPCLFSRTESPLWINILPVSLSKANDIFHEIAGLIWLKIRRGQ
ncbi:MAG: hypothetical protein CL816_04165 [Coxiellaceae bacterium]|nr:hypothetical protein [Coxiellaceae bacterium]